MEQYTYKLIRFVRDCNNHDKWIKEPRAIEKFSSYDDGEDYIKWKKEQGHCCSGIYYKIVKLEIAWKECLRTLDFLISEPSWEENKKLLQKIKNHIKEKKKCTKKENTIIDEVYDLWCSFNDHEAIQKLKQYKIINNKE